MNTRCDTSLGNLVIVSLIKFLSQSVLSVLFGKLIFKINKQFPDYIADWDMKNYKKYQKVKISNFINCGE